MPKACKQFVSLGQGQDTVTSLTLNVKFESEIGANDAITNGKKMNYKAIFKTSSRLICSDGGGSSAFTKVTTIIRSAQLII